MTKVFLFAFLSLTAAGIVQAQNTPASWIDQRAKLVPPEDTAIILEQRGQVLEQQHQQQAEKLTRKTEA